MAGWDDLTPDAKCERALALFDRKVPDGSLTADWGRIVDGVPAMPGSWRKRQLA